MQYKMDCSTPNIDLKFFRIYIYVIKDKSYPLLPWLMIPHVNKTLMLSVSF
jgi:hypothetical protein